MTQRRSRRISPAEAARTILDAVEPVDTEIVPLQEARERVLGVDVVSPIDVPPWDNSAMDGYAARGADLERGSQDETPVDLTIVEEVPAGVKPSRAVGAGEAVRVFTGAPIPRGADSVIRQEDTATPAQGVVRVERFRDIGRNVRRRGEDITRDAVVMERGTTLGAAQLGVLASVAQRQVQVVRQPRVALLASGDEIVDLDHADAILAGDRIASSNTYSLRAAIEEAGGIPVDLGIARDDPADVRERFSRAAGTDLLVTCAGMSVGEHDHLRALLESEGTGTKFWRLRSRPGAPVGFALVDRLPWIGLPGNPVSALVTFELFAKPAIRKLGGHRAWFKAPIRVRAAQPMSTPGLLQHFLRVVLEPTDDLPLARLTGPQGSGILTSLTRADALLVVPEDCEEVAVDTVLGALPLEGGLYGVDLPY